MLSVIENNIEELFECFSRYEDWVTEIHSNTRDHGSMCYRTKLIIKDIIKNFSKETFNLQNIVYEKRDVDKVINTAKLNTPFDYQDLLDEYKIWIKVDDIVKSLYWWQKIIVINSYSIHMRSCRDCRVSIDKTTKEDEIFEYIVHMRRCSGISGNKEFDELITELL